MTPEHQHTLGFETHMLGLTGGITELTPRQEQLEALRAARERVAAAANDRAAIYAFTPKGSKHQADVDETVAHFVEDSRGVNGSGVLVGFEQDMVDPDHSNLTEKVLNTLPPGLVAEAAQDELSAGRSPDQVAGVLSRLDDRLESKRGFETVQGRDCIVSPGAVLLHVTHETPKGTLRLTKLEHTVSDAGSLVESLARLEPPTAEQRANVSRNTIQWLRQRSLSLTAPVDAGSTGAERFDKTQRDRAMFKAGVTGGASRHESYASQLFSGALNPEIQQFIVAGLDGKNVANLGGGNARLGHELHEEHGVSVNITNVEPYPSEKVVSDPNADPVIRANPATEGFVEVSGLQPHSQDEVWAVFSVPAYLGSAEEVTTLFKNVKTLLKPGGVARIGHLGVVNPAENDPRLTAILTSLEEAAKQGYMVEAVDVKSTTTLLLTAPESPLPEAQANFHGPQSGEVLQGVLSPKEQAELFAEKMGGAMTPEAVEVMTGRINREQGQGTFLGPEYVKRELKTTEPGNRRYQIEKCSRDDMSGQVMLSYEAAAALLGSVTKEMIDTDLSDELKHLVTIHSEMPIDVNNSESYAAHARALYVTIKETSMRPDEWVKAIREGRGDTLSEAARNYAVKPGLARAALDEVYRRNKNVLHGSFGKDSGSIAERAEVQAEFLKAAVGSIEILTLGDPVLERIAGQFRWGDIESYGFHYDQLSRQRALNAKGFEAIMRYVANIQSMGPQSVKMMNEELGIVNFGSYNYNALLSMKEILDNPAERQINVYLRGKDSDHNGFVTESTVASSLSDTLCFEVATYEDVDRASTLVERLGLSVGKLTIAGHGDGRGITIASRCKLDRDRRAISGYSGLHKLIEKIIPNEKGEKDILLLSCSQGRAYDSRGSTAKILAEVAEGNVVVEAAPRVAWVHQRDAGHLQVVTNRYFELAKRLEKYKKWPGVVAAVRYFNDGTRRVPGTVRVSKSGQTRNDSGIVQIGA